MLDIQQVNQLHEDAMAAADLGFSARRRENEDEALTHFRRAFDLEKQAAMLVVDHAPTDDLSSVEPTRSILLRSAATLALYIGEEREAEKLVAQALLGEPPSKLIEELHDVLEQVRSVRKQGVLT